MTKPNGAETPTGGLEKDPILIRTDQLIEGARVPRFYEVWRSGVFKIKPPGQRVPLPEDKTPPQPDHAAKIPDWWRPNLEQIIEQPLAFVGFGDVHDRKERLVALWFRDESGELATRWVPRAAIARNKGLVDLAAYGLAIDEANVRAVMVYLRKMLVANPHMHRSAFAHRYGWQSQGDVQGWMFGSNWIGSERSVRPDPSTVNPLAEGFVVSGSMEPWVRFVEPEITGDTLDVRQRRLLLGSAFGSLLIRHVSWRPHVVHHWGGTAAGKTKWAQMTMSAFGDPTILTRTMDATTISMSAIFNHVDDFPLLYDEQQASTVDLAQMIYNIGGGQGRSRATKEGDLQGGRVQWWSLIRTTGEQSITGVEVADLGGQDTRCLQIEASDASKAAADLGNRIVAFFATRNWGAPAVYFLRKLWPVVTDAERKSALKDRFEKMRTWLISQMKGQFPDVKEAQLFMRAGHLALSAIGEWLVLEWLFGWQSAAAFDKAGEDALQIGLGGVNIAELQPLHMRVISFLKEHMHAEGHKYLDLTAADGWEELRRRRRQNPLTGLKSTGELWYFPEAIDHLLRRKGWDPRRVWADLRKHGYLKVDGAHLTRYRQLAPGGLPRQRFYVVDLYQFYPDEQEDGAAPPTVDPAEPPMPDDF